MVANLPPSAPKKFIIDSLTVKEPEDLKAVARTEARVFLLYSTQEEADHIMKMAKELGLTGKAYVWIVAQSVLGGNLDAPEGFPLGMLGVHFKTDRSTMIGEISPAMAVLGNALDQLTTTKTLSESDKKKVSATILQKKHDTLSFLVYVVLGLQS